MGKSYKKALAVWAGLAALQLAIGSAYGAEPTMTEEDFTTAKNCILTGAQVATGH